MACVFFFNCIVVSANRECAAFDPPPITYPTTKLENNTTNNNNNNFSSLSSRQELQPPLPASLTSTLHRPLRHISSSNCNFKTSHPKLVLIFSVPRCFSLNKGRWLNHLTLQQPLLVSRILVCFRVVGSCSV